MIEIKSELDEKMKNINDLKNDISDLKNIIDDLKNRDLLINKNRQDIKNENEKYFNNEEKNRIKKDNEIQELKRKLNDKNNTSEIKSNDDMPYLETEEEAAERIADFNEKKGKG